MGNCGNTILQILLLLFFDHKKGGIGGKIGASMGTSTKMLTYFWLINIKWVTVRTLFSLIAILLPLLFEHNMDGKRSSGGIGKLVLAAKLVVISGHIVAQSGTTIFLVCVAILKRIISYTL